MKLGYPCLNRSIGCQANQTFRLANYSAENLIAKVSNNLDCLAKILRYNVKQDLLYFRITSDLVPFASHPVCDFAWTTHFQSRLEALGRYIRDHHIRIAMHPDQFIILNAQKPTVVDNSIRELHYHSQLLDAMQLDDSAKIQIHVGGVYGDKKSALQRFVHVYSDLPDKIRRRLVIENDDRQYHLANCLNLYRKVGIPIVFDLFHHSCHNRGEPLGQALTAAAQTWQPQDGCLLVDYSTQKAKSRPGRHAVHLDPDHFRNFIRATRAWDFDLMLEIKDKEKSALQALKIIKDIRPCSGE